MKIAFQLMGSNKWIAGPVYLQNLLSTLKIMQTESIQPSLLAPINQKNVIDYAHFIGADDLALYQIPHRWSFPWIQSVLVKKPSLTNMIMETAETALSANNIDIVFGNIISYKFRNIATISLLPDFQHRILPEMFSKKERKSRDQSFLRSIKRSNIVMLMSKTVKRDLESFAPEYASKVRVLHSVSYIPHSIYEYDIGSVLHLYNLPEKFIYLPNQFWKHKNHEMVFKAVEILRKQNMKNKICIVCTGDSHDYRHPEYFDELFNKVSKWNIRDQIIYLGLIPHDHVLVLIRQSVCVLNPSLFEGWGITVDEARSVGKKQLLSDISPHREQDPAMAIYFNLQSCEELANKLRYVWEESKPGPDIELEFEARRNLPARLRSCGETFISIAQEAIDDVLSGRIPE